MPTTTEGYNEGDIVNANGVLHVLEPLSDSADTLVWKRWLPGRLPDADAEGDLSFAPDDTNTKIVGTLKAKTVDPSKLDADTEEKQKAIRDAIDAESKLVAGPGVRIGASNTAGKRTLAVAGEREVADDAFRKPPLEQDKPWRVPAIERDDPVIVELTCDNDENDPSYIGSTPINDTVEIVIKYTRRSAKTAEDRGIFGVATTLIKKDSTLSTPVMKDLFPNGTVTHLTLRIGESAEKAKSGRLIRLPVDAKDIANKSTMRTTIPLRRRAERLIDTNTTNNVVYAAVNFVVAGGKWQRDEASDLTAATIRASSLGPDADIGDIASDGVSIYVLDRRTFDVVAFTDGAEDEQKNLKGEDVKKDFDGHGTYAIGLAADEDSIYVMSDYGQVATYRAKDLVGTTFSTVPDTSALCYDDQDKGYLLIGTYEDETYSIVRSYAANVVGDGRSRRIVGRSSPNNMGMNDANPTFQLVALAYGDGVVYAGDGQTGRVYAFVAGHYDAKKGPPKNVLKGYDIRGLTVHNGRLYVAAGTGEGAGAASAFVIPRDTYGFPEGYRFTTLDQAALHKAARGLTPIQDGLVTIGAITSTSAKQKLIQSAPAFDLADDGALLSELELKIKQDPSTVGFNPGAAPKYREGATTTVGALRRQDAYTSGAAEGAAMAAVPIYNGSAELGTLRLYLTRNSNKELGYLFDYVPSSSSGTGLQLIIEARLTVGYLPFVQ